MAIVIDENLTASPAETRLPSGPIILRQILHSDLGGETASITYTLDGRHNVCFQTAQGQVKQIQINGLKIPGGANERSDTIALVEVGGGTDLGEIIIKQTIRAENNARDSVTLAILS
ncbi:MAG TPA: hypothetical protein VKK31_02025 [Thermoanaerobaculia bacterium]|nr:hypothetical protein [Thermoanaerobaculia bacterium]